MAAPAIFKAQENYNNIDKYRDDVVATLRLRLRREFANLDLGELVDDDVRNEHKSRSRFADCDVISKRIEEITRLAIEEQGDKNLQSFLKAESKAFLWSVLERNKQHKKNAEDYMNNLHLKFIAKYEKKAEEFLEIHPPLVFKHQVIQQSFHNKATQRLLEKYKKLDKPGTIAFKEEYESRLSAAFEEENISDQRTTFRHEETIMAYLIIFAFIFYILFGMILTVGLHYLHKQGGVIPEINRELDYEYSLNSTNTSIIGGLNNRIKFLESQIKRCDERRDMVSIIDNKILRNFKEKISNLTSEKINLQAVTQRCYNQSAIKSADIDRCNAENKHKTGQIDRCNAENARKTGQIDRLMQLMPI
ncbi:hypothetical protein Ocin01_17033 [Orchesella cincta]|uniref:Uncharacterized protein n=1 Tax=Orchesella cincta TaxID=48709 RepID=A0A1D2M9K0_ORCCI|nr:hypothetical protein Ocin01_17033 [Orchesella cincta]